MSGVVRVMASFVAAATMCACSATRNALPVVVASSGSGMGMNWELRVFPSGRVYQREWDAFSQSPDRDRHLHFNQAEVRYLLKVASETEFMSLPAVIESAAIMTDDSILSITVWEHGQQHTVSMDRHQTSLRPTEEVRFLRLWSILLEMASQVYH